jgi:hypothetical protein
MRERFKAKYSGAKARSEKAICGTAESRALSKTAGLEFARPFHRADSK